MDETAERNRKQRDELRSLFRFLQDQGKHDDEGDWYINLCFSKHHKSLEDAVRDWKSRVDKSLLKETEVVLDKEEVVAVRGILRLLDDVLHESGKDTGTAHTLTHLAAALISDHESIRKQALGEYREQEVRKG